MNLLLWSSGGMQAIFLLFRDVFESDQQALVLVLEPPIF